MRRSSWVMCTAAIVLLAGCQRARVSADFEAELMAADRAFNEATQAHGSAGWLSFFDGQSAMIQSGVGEIRGLGAIGEAIADLDDPTVKLTWEPLRAQGSADGTLGYTVGSYESTVSGDSGSSVAHGLYVTVWSRRPDGSLKVAMDLGNPVRD
jgi:ketosteroid isomerase-like protein